ncbi:enoyl-CoA hydratase/isomerase family protein [Nocardioides dongxiaopingii]|uniref:enoyl-CoA hydratase/isomerase family protein n=1 Tax=Nocardioides sp. S-1144 TaxID=2582905 RepID=UPI00110DDA3C|nr:enoyl-CoA hydratase/isomerase family protein [Nocardioides sp. S-1144]QCW50654.1 enoyl-CoA hydratase/isomerase family protein [Nocardioides sp. S-1144]
MTTDTGAPISPDRLAAARLRLEVDGAVATITLDRPEVRNAQTPTMWRTLAEIGAWLPDEVRVVVVRGAGATFSAGLDRTLLTPGGGDGQERVADLLTLDEEAFSRTVGEYQEGFTWLRDPRFVSIAAVRGHAIGAGFQLALSCDLVLAADDATFCMKEAALGLVPDLTGTKPLVDAVGYSRALEICATARNVGAEEAVRIGIAIDAVPGDALDARLAQLVTALTAPLPGAVRETKALLLGATDRDLDTQRRLEREAQGRRFRELAALLGGQQ